MNVPNKRWRDFKRYDLLEAAYLFCDMEPQDSSKPTPALVQKMKKALMDNVDKYIETGYDEVEFSNSETSSLFFKEDLKAFAKKNELYPRFLMEDETIPPQQGQEIDGQEHLSNPLPSYLDTKHLMHSKELRIAIEAWTAVLEGNPNKQKKGSRKKLIKDWLEKHYPKLTGQAKTRITIMLNPDRNGGAPPSD